MQSGEHVNALFTDQAHLKSVLCRRLHTITLKLTSPLLLHAIALLMLQLFMYFLHLVRVTNGFLDNWHWPYERSIFIKYFNIRRMSTLFVHLLYAKLYFKTIETRFFFIEYDTENLKHKQTKQINNWSIIQNAWHRTFENILCSQYI